MVTQLPPAVPHAAHNCHHRYHYLRDLQKHKNSGASRVITRVEDARGPVAAERVTSHNTESTGGLESQAPLPCAKGSPGRELFQRPSHSECDLVQFWERKNEWKKVSDGDDK